MKKINYFDDSIKPGDVFGLYLSEKEKQKFEPYWCFDCQLVAQKTTKGELVLVDTYWLHGFKNDGNHTKKFTLERAQELGKLKFKCNLNKVDFINKDQTKYYNKNDIFNLSYQHRSYSRFAIKKGAKKDQKRMEQELECKIDWLDNKISCSKRQLDETRNSLAEVRKGNLDVYI